jgi:hypothetical protein
MSESTLSAPRVKVARRRPALPSEPSVVSARRVRACIRRAKYVAVYVTVGPHGAANILDTTKAAVLRMLKHRSACWACEVFGTVILGRPEPI